MPEDGMKKGSLSRGRGQVSIRAMILLLVATVLASGLIGFFVGRSSANADPFETTGAITTPRHSSSGAIVVGSSNVRVELYIDYRCPYCLQLDDANAVNMNQLLASGSIEIAFHPMAMVATRADDDSSLRAANFMACVIDLAPELYNGLHRQVLARAGLAPLSDEDLIQLGHAAGIAKGPLTPCVTARRFSEWVTTNTQLDVGDPALIGQSSDAIQLPRVLIDGLTYEGNPKDSVAFEKFLTGAINNSR